MENQEILKELVEIRSAIQALHHIVNDYLQYLCRGAIRDHEAALAQQAEHCEPLVLNRFGYNGQLPTS